MTDSNETKKNLEGTSAGEEKNPLPPTIDLGDAADPFERLQTKKVAIAQGSSAEEKSEQIQSVVKK